MGKGAKVFGTLFLLLGLACIGLYFFMGDKFNDIKVVFDSNGGTSVLEQLLKKGEKVSKPTDPTKENSEFVEWQLDGKTYIFDSPVENDITLVAKWNDFKNYTVKVTLDGTDYTATIREGQSVTIELLNIPEKENYMIKFYNANNEEYNINNPVTGNLDLTASYIEIKTYTVKFNSNGGTKVESVKAQEGMTITAPTSTRDGYILNGWYLGEEKFDFTTPITKDITLNARWNDGPKINVIFMTDDKVYKTISVKENTTVSKPANPTKKGYKFVAWQLDGNNFDFKTKITTETTLTALFEESTTVTVTFNSDGGSKVSSQEVEIGSKAKAPKSPTKDGYKFVEWQLDGKKYDFNKEVNDNITLKAIWGKAKPKYTVKFNNDDGIEITSTVVEEGSKVDKPTDPKKDGYKFVGWLYNNSLFNFDTSITQSITLTARYERINTPDVLDEIFIGDDNPINEEDK